MNTRTRQLAAGTLLLGLAGLLFSSLWPGVAAARTWKDATGKFAIQGQLVSHDAGMVRIRRDSDGRIIRVPFDKLSQTDQQFLRGRGTAPPPASQPPASPPPSAAPPAPAAGETSPAETAPVDSERVTAPPASLGLAPFYKKHVSLRGFAIVSSEKVPDAALIAARKLVSAMLGERPEILGALRDNGVRMAIIARSEKTTDLPEYQSLQPKEFWDTRTRGIGATLQRPVTSAAEENILRYPDDPYLGESILIHEFAHTVHQVALAKLEPAFDARLQEAHREALKKGLWKDTYAANSYKEYWAEGVQSWFNANAESQVADGVHNQINTRDELQKYDPQLAELIDSVFP